jgi:threonine synthase
VGMIGMWKAFEEMEQLGWVKPGKRPRMFAIQSTGCAPIVQAFDEGAAASRMWTNPETAASGLRVPKAYGDYIVLDIVRASGGMAVAVSDEEIFTSLRDWAKNEGIFLSPEGAAATAAYAQLLAAGVLDASDRVVLFNTGAGLKYADVISAALGFELPG